MLSLHALSQRHGAVQCAWMELHVCLTELLRI